MPTTIILGAGIIGLSSAYSLTRIAPPGHKIHLVEAAPKLFSSASGKAAGFLAKDWFAPTVAPLGELSFELHRALAEQHGGRERWGYSESVSYSLDHAYQSDEPSPASDPPTSATAPAPGSGPSANGVARATQGTTDSPGRAKAPDSSTPAPPTDVSAPSSGSLGSNSAARADVRHEDPSSHNSSQGQGGLDWLLSGASRATVATVPDALLEKAHSETAAATPPDDLPGWLLADPEALEVISDRKSTAQVIPRRLCEFLLEQCLAAGVTLHHPARATKIVRDERDPASLTQLRIEYSQSGSPEARVRVVDIPCETIVIAAGCWTPQVYATLFPNASRMPRITHLAGYSVRLKTKRWPPTAPPTDRKPTKRAKLADTSTVPAPALLNSSTCHAVFTDTAGFAPEIFSRANGDVWLGGLNPPTASLPNLPTDAHIDQAEIDRLLVVGRVLCGEDIEVKGRALCFRPVSAMGRPIIARMHEADLGDGLKPYGLDGQGGVFVATGHGPWGITLSLGTGQVVAEMVLGRETSADVEPLSRW